MELSEEHKAKNTLIIKRLLQSEAEAGELKKLINVNDNQLKFLINNMTSSVLIYEENRSDRKTVYGILKLEDL